MASPEREVAVRTALHEGWKLRAVGGAVPAGLVGREIPAAVPGCATTDLLAAGEIPDPYLDENEAMLAWIGRTDWRFSTRFTADPVAEGERVDLVCDGLDTVATIELNGTVVGRTANMHRSYRFDLRGALDEGENELAVTFAAPLSYAEQMSEELGPRPHVNAHPFNSIRKMACSFGWDWGPDLASAGIWRPIGIERWRSARIGSVRPCVEVVHFSPAAGAQPAPARRAGAKVAVHVSLEHAGEPGDLRVRASLAGAEANVAVVSGEDVAIVQLDVADVELWWPTGYGTQPLYELEVVLEGRDETVAAGSGVEPLATWRGRVGFRTVELDTGADEIGRRFSIVVNGQPIAIRGANWIPDDCFVSRVDRPRYAARLGDAVEANMNLLRVWGGGIYESDDFYDVADELGILVWQDFLFACAAYAEEEPLRGEVVAEAREAVTRLARHPSLALWNGCNENIWGHEDWGWKDQLAGKTWGLGYYLDVLPAIVADLDPGRPYSPGSPWSPGLDGVHPNDPSNGTMHVWDVWNQRDYAAYREYAPRFVAEFGFQAPPTWATLTRAVRDEPLAVDGPGMLAHQKASDGQSKLERGLVPHLCSPRSVEDWHWATSLNQARAVTLGVEHWRSLTPRCAGMVVWQLNDCWPAVSWSAVDGDGRRKPLWYALRRSYRPQLLTIQPRGSRLAVLAVNDGETRWSATLPVRRFHFDGTELARDELAFDVAPGKSVELLLAASLAAPGEARSELVVAGDGPGRALWYFGEDREGGLPPPRLDTAVARVGDGYVVTMSAATLQRDVALLADKISPRASTDEMLLTLLPGESAQIHVRSVADLDAAGLVDATVLRSANQLVHFG